jgi:hypothetical protein
MRLSFKKHGFIEVNVVEITEEMLKNVLDKRKKAPI